MSVGTNRFSAVFHICRPPRRHTSVSFFFPRCRTSVSLLPASQHPRLSSSAQSLCNFRLLFQPVFFLLPLVFVCPITNDTFDRWPWETMQKILTGLQTGLSRTIRATGQALDTVGRQFELDPHVDRCKFFSSAIPAEFSFFDGFWPLISPCCIFLKLQCFLRREA